MRVNIECGPRVYVELLKQLANMWVVIDLSGNQNPSEEIVQRVKRSTFVPLQEIP